MTCGPDPKSKWGHPKIHGEMKGTNVHKYSQCQSPYNSALLSTAQVIEPSVAIAQQLLAEAGDKPDVRSIALGMLRTLNAHRWACLCRD